MDVGLLVMLWVEGCALGIGALLTWDGVKAAESLVWLFVREEEEGRDWWVDGMRWLCGRGWDWVCCGWAVFIHCQGVTRLMGSIGRVDICEVIG